MRFFVVFLRECNENLHFGLTEMDKMFSEWFGILLTSILGSFKLLKISSESFRIQCKQVLSIFEANRS